MIFFTQFFFKNTSLTQPMFYFFFYYFTTQGTARPTRYRCLYDEANMSEDKKEHLTYYLCHMFSRCTRSVSYPAPTYYAHLAAARWKDLIYK